MKDLGTILQGSKSFEPSQTCKKLLQMSLKKDTFNINIGPAQVEIPSYYDYDTEIYERYFWAVIAIYILEAIGAVSIFIISTSIVYTIVKLLVIAILIFGDLWLSRMARSRDDQLTRAYHTKKNVELVQHYYRDKLSQDGRDDDLVEIANIIKREEKKIAECKKYSFKFIYFLYAIAIVKLIIFFLDYTVPVFLGTITLSATLGSVFSSSIGFIICFFFTPLAYLTIPILAHTFYGKWQNTGNAFTQLTNELAEHDATFEEATTNGTGRVSHCIDYNAREINLENILQDLDIDDREEEDLRIGVSENGIGVERHRNFILNKDKNKIEWYGIPIDQDIVTLVSKFSGHAQKKMALCNALAFQSFDYQAGGGEILEYNAIRDRLKKLNHAVYIPNV